jgi:hypothetical protein
MRGNDAPPVGKNPLNRIMIALYRPIIGAVLRVLLLAVLLGLLLLVVTA